MSTGALAVLAACTFTPTFSSFSSIAIVTKPPCDQPLKNSLVLRRCRCCSTAWLATSMSYVACWWLCLTM